MTAAAPHPGRAEQAQPGGYVPPAAGAPTWPQPGGPPTVGPEVVVRVLGDLIDERDRLRAALAHEHAHAETLSGALGNRNAELDRLRGVIAAANVDLLAGRVDEALAALRAAGGQL